MIEIRVTRGVEAGKPEAMYDRLAQDSFLKLEKDIFTLLMRVDILEKLLKKLISLVEAEDT